MDCACPIVQTFHGESGAYIQDLTDLVTVEYTLGPNGAQNARVVVPSVGAQLHHTRLFPEGVGCFVRIDPGDIVPEPFVGRLVIPQFGGSSPEVSLNVDGPEEWLSATGVPLHATFTLSAADIVRDALLSATSSTWVQMGTASPSTQVSIPYQTTGASFWSLMTDLANTRGEEFYLHPVEQGVGFNLDWRHPLDSIDLSDTVSLVDGTNCLLGSSAMNLGLPMDSAIGMALSLGMGAETMGALVKAPPVARLGIREAMAAVFSTHAVRRLAGTGGSSFAGPEPSLVSQQAVEAAIESQLRRAMTATGTAQITDIDPAVWKHLRPGNLVHGVISDPFSVFSDVIIRIRSVTFGFVPVMTASASVELWSIRRVA